MFQRIRELAKVRTIATDLINMRNTTLIARENNPITRCGVRLAELKHRDHRDYCKPAYDANRFHKGHHGYTGVLGLK